jgi:indolepyruvate ferredoxin oxidoreductase
VVSVADLSTYRGLRRAKANVTLHGRESLEVVQAEMQQTEGVTAIVYEQVCAAELRRRRKHGATPDPLERIFINPAVCEGCGDCTRQSNCVAIVPVETEWGRKRAIDQSSCNKDFSCLDALCPAMVTVRASGAAKRESADISGPIAALPSPVPNSESANILLTGIGGTGVITVGAVLCMAAHLEGKGASAFDMTGLAQKGGAVYSHIRITDKVSESHASKIGLGGSDLIIGGDLAASIHESVLATTKGTTKCVMNTQYVPTASFQLDNDAPFHDKETLIRFEREFSPDRFVALNASVAALELVGDTLQSNMLLLGFALQRGWLPVGAAALKEAIHLNGQSVSRNITALNLGRLAAANRVAFDSLLARAPNPASETTLTEFIRRRRCFLSEYQNAGYASDFERRVDKVRRAEELACPGSERLCWAAARSVSQLMSYKDEYEVARLYTSGAFPQMLKDAFGEKYSFNYHLSPPMLSAPDKLGNRPSKIRMGEWLTPVFRLLARLKFLRGTPFDLFGYTSERRMERHFVRHLAETIDFLVARLSPSTLDAAVAIVERYQAIRGFGEVKRRKAEAVLAEIDARKAELIGGREAASTRKAG